MSLHASRSSSEQMQQLLKQIEAAAMERAATSEAMQALASQLEIKAQRIVTLEAMLANDVKNDSNSLPLPGNCSMSEVDSFSSRASSEERGPLGALEDLADTSSLYTSSVLSASNALESLMSVLIGCYVFYYFVYNEWKQQKLIKPSGTFDAICEKKHNVTKRQRRTYNVVIKIYIWDIQSKHTPSLL